VYETTTAPLDEAMEITALLGSDVTHEIGKTTGDDQVYGITTVDGTYLNEETLTVLMRVTGIETIALDGTDEGTLVYATTASPEEIITTCVDGSEETTDCGTTTGLSNDEGILTVVVSVI